MLALEIPLVSCQLEKFDSLEGLLNTCSGIARVSSGTRSPGHRCMGLWFNRNRWHLSSKLTGLVQLNFLLRI